MCKALKDERCDKRAIQKSSTKIPQARYAGDGGSFEKINEEYCFFYNIDNNHSKSYNLLKDNKELK